jgi:hypothetical protein
VRRRNLAVVSRKEAVFRNEYEESVLGHLVPMVVEQSARGERAYDIYSRLLKEPDYGPTAVP